MPVGDCLNGFSVAGSPPDMDTHDGRRLIVDQGIKSIRIEIVHAGINVAEDRLYAFPLHCMRLGDECKRRQDHFAGKLQRMAGDLDAEGCVTHKKTMADAEVRAKPFLKTFHQEAHIGIPTAFEKILDQSGEHGGVHLVGQSDVHRFFRLFARFQKRIPFAVIRCCLMRAVMNAKTPQIHAFVKPSTTKRKQTKYGSCREESSPPCVSDTEAKITYSDTHIETVLR